MRKMKNELETINKQQSELEKLSFTDNYIADIKQIFTCSREYVKSHVNYAMVYAYWLTGKRIVLQEQNGSNRADDNPTIGILLCSETDKTVAKYSVLNESKHIFASKYLTLLPTEKELEEEIEHQKQIFAETHSFIEGTN